MTSLDYLESSKFIFRIEKHLIPEGIDNLFGRPTHNYNTRNRNVPLIEQHSRSIFNNSFLCQSRLAQDVKEVSSLSSFKSRFKKMLVL